MASRLSIILILYLKIFCVLCKGNSSLTFVIDDTGSMWNNIKEVIRGSQDLLEYVLKTKSSEIDDLVLVTFNDPDVKLRAKTKSRTQFIRALKHIYVDGGVDCPEYSITGIIEALRNSKPNSYLYVFTDANAKDFRRVDEVINLCEQKQSQIIFVLTGKCDSWEYGIEGYNVYNKIAKACSGTIISIGTHEVHLAVETIKEIVGDKKTIVSIATVQHSFFPTPVTFTLDEKIEHAIITISGPGVVFDIRKSNNFYQPILATEKKMWTPNFKVVKLVNSYPGNYTVWVKGNGEVSIVVYGKTDLTFEHGFSDFVPKSLADTSKQPIAGKNHYLSIAVRDPAHEVNIKTAAILSTDEKVLMEFPLKKIGPDFYVTDNFLPPETTFKVAVKGIIIKTGKPIIRVSKISVQPRLPDAKIPIVSIKEGSKIELNYGSNVSLTCEVSGYPKPKINWYDSDHNLYESQSTMVEFPYKYISTLKLNDEKRSNSYICEASNDLRTTRNSIQVNVISPLKKIVTLPGVTNAEYGKELKLKCLVNSTRPTETHWYFTGPKDKLSLSADRSELSIKDMDINLEGIYTCKISLKEDPKIAEVQSTRVKIVDLARPEVKFDSGHITIPEKSKATITCRIVKGTPRPKISWQYRKNDGSDTISLNGTSEDLTINNVSLNYSGKYVCTATNDFGSASAVIGLEVLKSPEIFPEGGRHANVLYGSTHVFTCRIVAHPSPTIVWKDALGDILPSTTVSTNDYEFTSQLVLQDIRKRGTYFCFAENSVGKSDQRFEVFVRAPFPYDTKRNVVTEAKYGEEIKLKCDVTSAFPVERNWIVNSSKQFIKSDDKYSLSPDASELVIKAMEINLQGTYVCRVRLVADPSLFVEKNNTIIINDLAPPKIASSKEVLNQTFIARCIISRGVPRPVVTWKFKGDSGNIRYLDAKGEILIIKNIQRQHNGSYQCIAKNIVGTDRAILSLEVQESPQILTEKTEYRGLVGDEVLVIPCNVTGYPDPTIIWKNSKNEVIETGSKYAIKGSSNILSLYILKPLEEDTGKFICEARNKAGTTATIFDVLIETDVTEELGDKHNVYLLESESRDINCTLLDTNGHSLRWYKNGYLTNVTGATYAIKNATVSDDGNYTCRVNTDVGSMSETFVVDVGYEPMFEYDETLISWFGDEVDVVDCNVRAKPMAKVEWIVNGKKTNNKQFQHHISGWGNYKCKVSNIHGNIEKTVTVTTPGCLINRTMDDNNNPPFILNTIINVDYDEPVINNNKYMFIDPGQQMKLTCYKSGNNTFNLFPDKDTIIAECDREDKFISDDITYKYSDLKCKKPLKPTLKVTGKKCVNVDSEVVEIGFEVPNFVKAYEVCFDIKQNVPNFMYLKLSQHNLGNEVRKWTDDDSVEGIDYCSEESTCCYGKSPLVNAADLDIGPPQITPSADLNGISLWKPCDKENRVITWRKLEEAVRSLLLSYPAIQVWTGASEYEIVDVRRVPRYLWKVLKVNEEILAVFVYVNTPKPKPEDIKCKKPEEVSEELQIGDDPYTYLCSLEEFCMAFAVPLETFSRNIID